VTATALSTNVIDLKAAGIPFGAAAALESNAGKGEPIDFLIQCTTTATAAGAATVTITIETDDNSSLSSATTLWTSGAIPKADLVAGYKVPVRYLPLGAYEQYLAVRYTVATGPLTAGKFFAGVNCGSDHSWNT